MNRSLFFSLAMAVATLGLGACAHHSDVSTQSSAANAPAAAGGTVVVTRGTNFYGKLEAPIGTKTSVNGTPFALDETRSSNPALKGAIIDGHLAGVSAAGPMHDPKMTLVFDDIRMPDGSKDPINVTLVSTHEFNPKTHHLRTIGLMIGGAIAGHEVAKHTGKKHGGLIGAAGGYALSQSLKTDIYVPAGSVVELRFAAPVTSAAASAGQSGT